MRRGEPFLAIRWPPVYNKIKATPALTKLINAKGKKLRATWRRVKGVTGYELWYATDSKFKSPKKGNIKSDQTVNRSIGGMKKGATYYAKIRSYYTSGGKTWYSKWSETKQVKITK